MKVIKAPINVYQRVVEKIQVEIDGKVYTAYYDSDNKGADLTVFDHDPDEIKHPETYIHKVSDEVYQRVQFIFDEVRQWKDLEDGEEIDEQEYQELKEEYGY